MKIYKLPQLAEMSPEGDYCLGSKDLKSEAVYLYYGRLRPGEKDRTLKAAEGYEEIVYIIKGGLTVKRGRTSFQATAGEAFHCVDEVLIDNPNDDETIYIAAGGRGRETLEDPVKEPRKEDPAEEGSATPEEPATPPEDPEAEETDEFIITDD
jgi:redox-sensitive bicupin YhaK (pirin superfamily)